MAAPSAESRHHRARIAALSRDRAPDDPEIVSARRLHDYSRLSDQAAKVVADWPTPPPEVLEKVAAILRGASPPTAVQQPDPAVPQSPHAPEDRKSAVAERIAELDAASGGR